MIQIGLLPSQTLESLLQDEEGNWINVPEGQTVVPLVKLDKPAPVNGKKWTPSLTWFPDRVERGWTQQNADPLPVPYTIPPRQFRLWLANNNLMTSARAVINGMPEGPEKEKALIEWDYAVAIERDHPLTLLVATAIGLTPSQIDQAFREASQL